VTRFAAIADDWRGRLIQTGLTEPATLLGSDPPGVLEGEWEPLVKPGLGGRERWRWRLANARLVLFVKRYLRTPLRQQVDRILRQTLRHSRAWWEYHQSGELNRRYVSTVRAVGVAEEMRSIFERRSAVLFERVPGDALDRLWLKLEAEGSRLVRAPLRQGLIRCLARFTSAFHQTGMCHRDLYLCHIFADLDPESGRKPRFTLIDLARVHRPRWRRLRWIIKDLSQLDSSACQVGASRADRLRFLVAYLGLQPGAPRTRDYARRVVRKSAKILRRIARKRERA
jgi:hypothetical protein